MCVPKEIKGRTQRKPILKLRGGGDSPYAPWNQGFPWKPINKNIFIRKKEGPKGIAPQVLHF
jgi:hypothetical protein